RYNILNLYITCKQFGWLTKLSITSVEKCMAGKGISTDAFDITHSTFDIFGNDISLQLVFNEYAIHSINGFSGFYNEDIKFCVAYPFSCYDGQSECYNYYMVNNTEGYVDDNDIINVLTKINEQISQL